MDVSNNISNELIFWYMSNKRDLPWRQTYDPYHIWVSEIILQQTRVAQGLEYYNRFIEAFPTVFSLANADQEQILKLWQGLGYYSRARNMHTAAKQIIEIHDGIFPKSSRELLSLKGIGEYTANAVASLAFNEPVAVVDGNVIRVISRLFALQEPVDKLSVLKNIKELASEILSKEKPGMHNQAIMEFGALHCTPINPGCTSCPLNNRCLALKYRITDKIPYKSIKVKVKERYFTYLVMHVNSGFYFQKRSSGDIWEGLYEFPLIETQEPVTAENLLNVINAKLDFCSPKFQVVNISEPIKHILTHQKLNVCFIEIKLENLLTNLQEKWLWTDINKIHQLAVPRVIDKYIHSAYFNKKNGLMQ